MQKYGNENMDMINNLGVMNPSYDMPEVEANTLLNYQMVYPEIFYKLQPYVMMVVDQMDYSFIMPTMETVQQMTDKIYDDVSKMYPELAEYAKSSEVTVSADPIYGTPYDRDRDWDRNRRDRRFRRGGLFKDIIDILLLSELFGRRRRFF